MLQKYRSSRLEVFCRKGVLRNFEKFTGKHLCQSLLFNKVAGLKHVTLLKKRLWHSCFPVNFSKFLRTPSVAASENICEPADFQGRIGRSATLLKPNVFTRSSKYMCFKPFKARKYYYDRTSANENVKKNGMCKQNLTDICQNQMFLCDMLLLQ